MFSYFKIFFILSFYFISETSYSACASPAGVAGEMKYIVNTPVGTVKYCNGTSWLSAEVSNLGDNCTTPGVIKYDSLRVSTPTIFCGGNTVTSTYTWRSMNGTASGSICTQAGQIQYSSGLNKMRICNSSVWDDVGISPAVITTSPVNGFYQCGGSGAQLPVTVTNTGGTTTSAISVVLGGANPGDFVISSNTCTTLAPSASCTFNIDFPLLLSAPNRFANVTISATTGGTSTFSLEGYAISEACSQ